MWSGFKAIKLNISRELELYHAQNQADPENHAGLAPDPDPDPKKIWICFQNIKSATMPDHHVKGQPAASTNVQEKGGIKKDALHPVVM